MDLASERLAVEFDSIGVAELGHTAQQIARLSSGAVTVAAVCGESDAAQG
ncbi:hypothetical protein [Lentzea nigeriaca]|nr:hypothetical protein [Lentzea nigeriaca]MBM7863560.1 hypothetical protein [Lentzea nigeriaca]